MKILESKADAREMVRQWRSASQKIGLVPTMGYFHQGHLSLMEECKRHADKVIVSIFVNPTQFAPNEDLASYPRDLDRDKKLAETQGIDALFIPRDDQIYAPEHKTWVVVEDLSNGLCGKSRPTHFRGVATIVTKLFNIIQPDVAVFGQKDFQQLQIIRRMVRDLDLPIRILGCPIVREPDGLAMSSRNAYLTEEQRPSALCLYQALQLADRLVREEGVESCSQIQTRLRQKIESFPFTRIDYIFTGDPDTLKPLEQVERPLLVALAVFVGTTRLIDNILI